MRPDRLLVTFRGGLDENGERNVHQALGGRLLHVVRGSGVRVIQVTPGRLDDMLRAYRNRSEVLSVETDRVLGVAMVPGDPLQGQQWALTKIHAPEAWDITAGDSAVKIAILDCGINAAHPDLSGKIAAAADFSGSGGTDDRCDHGTHTAGVAAAGFDNAVGVAGVGGRSVLLNGKVLGDDGLGSESALIQGLTWAADNGAKVINLSLAAPGACSASLQTAIDYAWNKGAVVVAAAGNGGQQTVSVPAVCQHVVSVGATDQNDARAPFSNYGSGKVSLGAPGIGVYSTTADGGYGLKGGTSIAAAHVSGVAALVWASQWGAGSQAVVDRLVGTSDQTPSGDWTAGRVNAYRAVSADAARSVPTPTASVTPTGTPTVFVAAACGTPSITLPGAVTLTPNMDPLVPQTATASTSATVQSRNCTFSLTASVPASPGFPDGYLSASCDGQPAVQLAAGSTTTVCTNVAGTTGNRTKAVAIDYLVATGWTIGNGTYVPAVTWTITQP